MEKIIQKIQTIKEHKDFNNDRCINVIFDLMKDGISIDEVDRLFLAVVESYKIGKHRSPSYIRQIFKKEMKFVNKEFREFYE